MADSETRELTVTTGPDPESAALMRVTVRDSGPGLDKGVLAQLFQPFVTTKEKGMGLGLSICRSIVEAHGGRLWLEPGAGGATFAFTVPVAGEDDAP